MGTDNGVPVVTAPIDTTIPCQAGVPPAVTPDFTLGCPLLEDAGLVTVDVNDITSSDNCPTTVERTYTVTDACGQSDSDVQIISLEDNEAPRFLDPLPPSQIEIECTDDLPQYNIQIEDNCDPNPVLTQLPLSPAVELPSVGACPANTQQIRRWLARDNCGNETPFEQIVIIDNTPTLPCTPVDCIPQACDQSSCPSQDCDCCSGEALPCAPVDCSPAPCSSVPCIAVACSACDFPTQITTCQPRVCAPQYIYINDDDGVAANRGPVNNLKKVKNYPGVSGASNLVVSVVLLAAGILSAFSLLL